MHPLLETHKHQSDGASLFFPSSLSVHLDRIVTKVLYVQDGAVNVGKIQLLKANQCLHLHAQALLISPGFGIVTPTEEMETLRTGTLK